MRTDRRFLITVLLTATILASSLVGCGSATRTDGSSGSGGATTTASEPAKRQTRQFIPELGIYVSVPSDWVAFPVDTHANMGMVTFQLRPKWESEVLAQYVRIRKLAPIEGQQQVQKWLNSSNADDVEDFVRTRKAKATEDKRDSWDGPGLSGASATIELENPSAPGGKPASALTPKIYVAFVGQGDQRWQIATSNDGPDGAPADQFFGEQADRIARSVQLLKQ